MKRQYVVTIKNESGSRLWERVITDVTFGRAVWQAAQIRHRLIDETAEKLRIVSVIEI